MCVINQVGRSIPFTISILSTYVDLGLAIQATHGPLQHQDHLLWKQYMFTYIFELFNQRIKKSLTF